MLLEVCPRERPGGGSYEMHVRPIGGVTHTEPFTARFGGEWYRPSCLVRKWDHIASRDFSIIQCIAQRQ